MGSTPYAVQIVNNPLREYSAVAIHIKGEYIPPDGVRCHDTRFLRIMMVLTLCKLFDVLKAAPLARLG
jgi:hypothetical protein